MPAIFTSDGHFLHYQCDHLHCQRATSHPDTRQGVHYAWCQVHNAERLAVSFDSLDDGYVDERERLRLSPLAYFEDGRPRASHLGPWDVGMPLSAETDMRVLRTWRDSADHLYRLITR